MDALPTKSMMHRFIQLLYRLQIKVLLVFSPAALFHKLSMLNWYSDTLHRSIERYMNNGTLRVLDVGCASGYLSEYLYQAGHAVSGIDVSKSMIKAAKRRMPEIEFTLGDACKLPYANDSFDLVLSASLINIIPEPSKLVEQMLRVCKADGWITLLFPVSGFDNDDLNECISSLGISGFSKAALLTWHTSAPKIPVDDVITLLRNHHLSLGEAKYYLNGMIASVSASKEFLSL